MYVDGSDFEQIFPTPQGPIQVLAEVHILGLHLVLDELLIFPENKPRLEIGVRQSLAIVRKLRVAAKDQGFAEMTVTYHRVGKPQCGQSVARTRRLQ